MFDSKLKLIAKIIQDKTGLTFPEDRLNVFGAKIEKRMNELNIKSIEEYLNYLILFDQENNELIKLINTLTINETFFFRHPQHFDILRNIIIPEICENNLKLNKPYETFRVWSAGCASGCETYSIAIILKELEDRIKASNFTNIEIIGTDIDTDILKYCERGIYTNRCVNTATPDIYKKMYFIEENGDYKLKNEIKKMVIFKRLNLMKDIYPTNVDIIFCRNVLYYFDLQIQKEILKAFYNSLKNVGYLFLGGTETLNLQEYFEIRYAFDSFYYKKWTTERRYYTDTKVKGVVRKDSAYWPPPEIKLRKIHNYNVIIFSGVFGDNCDINKMKQEILFAYSQMDKKEIEEISILTNQSCHIIYFDFENIRWIKNNIIAEIKDVILYLRSKNVKVNIIIGNNTAIEEWLNKANFKDFSNIIKELTIKVKEKPERPKEVISKIDLDLKKIIHDQPRITLTPDYPVFKEKTPLKKEEKKIDEKSKEEIKFIINNCSEKELDELKKQISKSLKTKKMLIIDTTKAVYLSKDFFNIISKALEASENKDFIKIIK
ncbi:MAG TPA: protein-glutamate O-methyltransferase CheR [bacterium]|nr:protein-glutamate O-methyltransferase CheR [bacterium]